jgi:SAM-dependent methyltransferase
LRVCLACGRRFESEDWRCPDCKFEPEKIRGIVAFAPESAASNDGYDPGYFQDLDASIENSFWNRAREELFIWVIRKYFHGAEKFLEIGCGGGLMLSSIARGVRSLSVFGSEIFVEGLADIPSRLPGATVFQADARRMPFEDEFDIIGAFDVIEHIDEDQRVLDEMFRATKPGGGILVSVPHHPFLWSQRDEYLHHKRRYTRKGLLDRVKTAGFEVIRTTAFVSIPFPAMVVESLRNRKPRSGYNPLEGLRKTGPVNTVLTGLLWFERQLIRAGASFPFGGSLLVVARKPK